MNGSLGRGPTLGVAAAVALLLLNAGVSFLTIRQLREDSGLVAHTYEVLDATQDLLAASGEAEAAHRTFIVTGSDEPLREFRDAAAILPVRVERLRELTADNPAQHERVADLDAPLRTATEVLSRSAAARKDEGFEAAREIVQTGKSRQELENLRALVGEIEAHERDLLRTRRQAIDRAYAVAVASSLAATLAGLAGVATLAWLLRRHLRSRAGAAAALQRAHDNLEERVRDRTAELRATADELRRSNAELERFASVASHDLQEPLRKVQAFGDRLGARFGDTLGEQGRDYLERMRAAAARMSSLINDLLAFSRVATRVLPFAPVDLDHEARQVVADLEERLHDTGGRVEVGELPVVEADPLQMRQLLQNLIANGLKFHRPDVPPEVRVAGRLLDGSLELSVSDNGIGFEEKYLDRIFQLFQRLHSRDEYAGTGIGLAICRKIVERHGGTITARSAPGQGATFLVTLPRIQSPQRETP